jgi:hypothetical protein
MDPENTADDQHSGKSISFDEALAKTGKEIDSLSLTELEQN